MAGVVLDQYYPGGCFKQISDAAGGQNIVYDQNRPGGAVEQLRLLLDPTGALKWDTHAPGGPWGQALTIVNAGSGSSAPAWVPANAKIHIDFIGNRAWSNGAQVAINTLLGSDPNTENGWGTTSYDPAYLTANGYTGGFVALIGVALANIIAGCTYVIRIRLGPSASDFVSTLALMAADGNDAIYCDLQLSLGNARIETNATEGGLGPAGDGHLGISGCSVAGEGAINVFAVTLTNTRAEFAVNGSAPAAGVLTAADRPPGNPLVAASFGSPQDDAIQSITIYDPLPTTAGLSALSQVT